MRKLNSQDFALLSDHVYGKEGKDGVARLVYDNNDDKKREITLNGITYKVEKIIDNPQNGYFGAVYIRKDTNEIIVSHRGTEFGTRQDREADMRMVRDRTNPQYDDAKALTEAAERWKKSQAPNAVIYQTGHSLGGALAQLCGHRYGQYTETFNAFGAAGLKEALPLNPAALDNIVNHRMGGDYVASAANHLGRSILYTTPREVSNLKKGGFSTPDTADDKFMANAGIRRNGWHFSSDLYDSHSVSNFTHIGDPSVLSPQSNAHRLAQENMAVLERFGNHVKEEIRKSPEKFEKYFEWADKYIAENHQQKPNPEQPQYAQAETPLRTPGIDDMPDKARELASQVKERYIAFHRERGLPYNEGEADRIAAALGVAAYRERVPEIEELYINEHNMITVGHETRAGDLTYASMDAAKAAATKIDESIARSFEVEQVLAREDRQLEMETAQYRAQSQGMSRSL